jgi:hypothetical protein
MWFTIYLERFTFGSHTALPEVAKESGLTLNNVRTRG